MSRPSVSIIVPCRNEVRFIVKFLDSLLANDYPKTSLQVLIVDGMSDDGTRDLIKTYTNQIDFISLLDNPQKITPTALNIGIRAAKSEIIMRMDVHAEYPTNYISDLVAALTESGADNVGGVCITLPAKDTLISKAIAIAMAHPFGVGNAYFRIGVTEPKWADTVPFGCYRKTVFDRIGLFDEELIRNQDDEFNLRLIKHGGKILLTPKVVSYYYARESLSKLWRMYFQYGYFKPLVVRKIGAILTVRQLVPGAFVLSLALLTLFAPWVELAFLPFLGLVFTYIAANICATGITVARTKAKSALALPLVFPVIHIAYGTGFLKGIVDFLLSQKVKSNRRIEVDLSR